MNTPPETIELKDIPTVGEDGKSTLVTVHVPFRTRVFQMLGNFRN